MTTPLTNSYIDKFDEKLKIYDSIFFKTVTGHGGLLSELATIKNTSSLPTEADYGADGATNYSTDQFAKFIKNIVNFNIKNFDQFNSTTTYNNLTFVKNTKAAGVTPVEHIFNDKITKNIIETLKVINVFVDILEAYKFCIENDTASAENTPLIPATGYTADINIDSIELVSDTTRFYHSSTMYPSKSAHKNVGYIRIVNKDSDNTVKSTRTVLFLSIESFYTGMQDPYNYNNCFDKTKISTSGSIVNAISTDIFTAGARASPATPITLDNLLYARQVYSGRASDDAAAQTNISLDDRNKALVKSLLKMLFNLEPKYRKPNVLALYYYYKFVQLYSTLIINVSNVMYANVELENTNPKRIETRNMSTQKNKRSVSGIQVTTAGVGYGTTLRTVSAAAPAGGGNGVSATLSLDGTTIPLNTVVNITDGGTLYDSAPSTITIVGNDPTDAGSGASTVTAVKAVLIGTVIPIAIKDDGLVTQDKNLDKLRDVINEISDSLSEIMNELSKTVIIENVITTADGYSPASVSYSSDADNRVVINITNTPTYNTLNNLNIKNDLVSDYIIYDKINSYYYTILKVIDNGNNDFKIKLNAIFVDSDRPTTQDELSLDVKVFKNASNGNISPLPTDASPTTIPSAAPYLIITKKDINALKSEYINNRTEVEVLDSNIKFNTTKIEHHKNLYETQYNKNVFLNRQILSYNIIIGAIILMLVIINLFNVEKQLVKTISLASLGALLLLFAIYFISNITYIETFAETSHMLYKASKEYITVEKGKVNARSNTEIYAEKPTILTNEINKLNSKFIGYFEKIIIALPSSDSTDFYSEIKDVITNDKDKKKYIDQMLEIKKVQGTNDMDTIKYEIEQSKLYIMVLLVASIVFITLYNIYVNYISDDKYLSLMLFICGIILIIIVSYYIINSNRRVRTVYKNIYWGPEHSANF
jgi:hypothetical protein